ncbi:MAG: [Fe-Fe] hydrogenase large subunit C-terminal domain-containing protein [Candidatus Daviesbacteria bacterium]
MEQKNLEIEELLQALKQNQLLVAMLAPSFPIVFPFPQIIGKLKRLGFKHVVEVSHGAQETNRQLIQLLQQNPNDRYITSPCPSIVRLIRSKYPHLQQFLAPIDSPMVATTKKIHQHLPVAKVVFIGPCLVKKLEAKEDHPDLNILVLTYHELLQIFEQRIINNESSDNFASFDLFGSTTRLYPISGGLSQSAQLNTLLTDEEYDVVSGVELAEKSLEEFPTNRVKVLDILFCGGGCIAGVGISSSLSVEERREKIIQYQQLNNKD